MPLISVITLNWLIFNNTSLEIQLVEGASEDLPGKIMQFLNANTCKNWQISISDKPSNPTLQEEDNQVREKQLYLASMATSCGTRGVKSISRRKGYRCC